MTDSPRSSPPGTPHGRPAKLLARARRAPTRTAAIVLLVLFAAYAAYLSVRVIAAFEGRRWDVPAHVYAAPLELYAGMTLEALELTAYLQQAGYAETGDPAPGQPAPGHPAPGKYRTAADSVTFTTRAFRHWDALEPSRSLTASFAGGRLAGLDTAAGSVPLARLEPVRLGSLFAAHHEDRILVEPEEIPPLLVGALKAVEDRRFDDHHGLDFVAIGRAAFVNLRAGEIRQGGSTLTQQLVKSYFLDNRRTFRRKFQEAIMAVALELSYDKSELLHAYVNEVYLGQQGARAIHGFGLASEYYFSKRLAELDLPEIALLVGLVNGPSYFDPRRHPERALARRNLVLGVLADEGVVEAGAAREAAEEDLRVGDGTRLLSRYQPAFMDLVRHELAADYPVEVLETEGLRIFTSLDPQVQSLAEHELAEGLAALEGQPPQDAGAALDGAVVVTRHATGDVLAMVGGRNVEYDGFNRALAARRPAGSLVKPAVYLAAIETGRYTLASRIEDEPLAIELGNGRTWSPENFDLTSHGEVPLLRALADSYNQATVRLGMDVGVDAVARLLHGLGLPEVPRARPSLLLGAVDVSPFEMAAVYGTLANGGFRVPLTAVRSVIDATGEPMARYPLEMTPAADPAAVQQVNAALVQAILRGTGEIARPLLPAGLVAAGKTGTSSGFRDSWFAGFTKDHVAVVWVGRDDNQPSGLTGATGALRIWAPLVAGLRQAASYAPAPAPGLVDTWLDYETGFATVEGCGDAVLVPLPEGAEPPWLDGCRRGLRRLGERLRDIFGGED